MPIRPAYEVTPRTAWGRAGGEPSFLTNHEVDHRYTSNRLSLHFLAERDGMDKRFVQLVAVEFTLPSADDDCRDAIADQIGQRSALTHKFVDADNDGKRRNRKVRDDR